MYGKNNPMDGITLHHIIIYLVDVYGRGGLAKIFPYNCFYTDPSISSSLKFLRKENRAREEIEKLYLEHIQKNTIDT